LAPPSPAPSNTARRGRTARETRERLARAALELFTTRGFHATTTPLIAARAGVAEGTIYRHFPSKDDLLNEVFRASVRALAEPVRAADPAMPCRARLDHVIDRWVALATKEPALVRLVFGGAVTELLDERSRAALRDLRGLIEQTVAGGKAAGTVRHGGVDVWTEVWFRLAVLVLERAAAGAWQAGDPSMMQVRQAAWDAIRAQDAPVAPDASTTQNPITGETT
jgi:AcrR family transcriptional regulator